ncbi:MULTISPECIES: N-acetylmuramoyl-L-alanine amidase [unclassified Pedobacter]|uniref:N-acetylmuramoyl-L-alanine amidase n=1 Tax=unclassified Pedobacter TaxID=2628915 RepID=UPI0014221322|nr:MULTISPECIES: N-acetylmuramoyl-L-alanine amidase [unclassified Pedobacter]NII84197.1 N-acetylmuramoyl-L-alanine amidase [Pedobacter sp. SG908]NMN38887.1 N-acetylmuramoyl-L-alanine amidase [Pedobacter sp. SG918]
MLFSRLSKSLSISAFSLVLILSACGSSKYAATEKIYKEKAKDFSKIINTTPPAGQLYDSLGAANQEWIGSVNFGIRKPNFVVIHHTAQDSLAQTIKTFFSTKAGTSAHYVISRDGKVVHMVNDYLRANHAGVSKWGKDTDLNSSSIGIELDNNGLTDPWPDVQINSLLKLLATLKKTYGIPTANFIGHADIAPKRKNDPKNFPWKKLADKGFGYWYDDVLKNPPVDFNTEMALRYIGYDTSNLPAAITAFKIHFIQSDITPTLTPVDILVLYNVYTKY